MANTSRPAIDRALFYWSAVARSPLGRFGTLLGSTPESLGGTLRIESIEDDVSVVSAVPPKWTYDESSSVGGGRLRLSSALALVDEISTYAGVCAWDRSGGRPGASIQLAARTVCPEGYVDAGHGERLSFVTRKVRVGKMVAFVRCDVRLGNNDLIKTSHVKYMPSGFPFDLLLRPALSGVMFPLIKAGCDRMPLHDHSIPESIDSIFQLTEGNGNQECQLKVIPDHANPLGRLHGGASVLLTEIIAARAKGEQVPNPRPRWIKSNFVRSVEANRHKIAKVEVVDHCAATTEARVSHKGNTCVETFVEWFE